MNRENFWFSLPGRHDVNEDNVLAPVTVGDLTLFGIADGVGGSDRGEVAAQLVLDVARQHFQHDPKTAIPHLFLRAREAVVRTQSKNPELGSLSTTLTLCVLDHSTLTASCGHVGDCRLYHLSGDGLVTRTKDQTEAQQLVEEGVLRPEQARSYPRKNVLTSAISSKRDYTLWSSNFPVKLGDRLIACSDGFYAIVTKREIVGLSTSNASSALLVQNLSALAESRAPTDDCSMVLLDV